MDTRVCDDCEPEGGDAASVTSEVGCRRRSRLTGAAQHSHKRRSVTFDLPPQVERAPRAAASVPSPNRDAVVEDEEMVPPWELPGGLVCARESIFVIPGVDCLGCLLGHRTLKPVVDALRRNAAHLPEEAWPAAGLAAYEGLRAKCRAEGLLAPEWSEEGIRLHFWQHALDPVLEAARLARSLDLARRLLMGEVQACIGGGDGTVPPQKLCLLDRLGAAEAKQHAWIQKLRAACESEQAREGPSRAARRARRGRSGAAALSALSACSGARRRPRLEPRPLRGRRRRRRTCWLPPLRPLGPAQHLRRSQRHRPVCSAHPAHLPPLPHLPHLPPLPRPARPPPPARQPTPASCTSSAGRRAAAATRGPRRKSRHAGGRRRWPPRALG